MNRGVRDIAPKPSSSVPPPTPDPSSAPPTPPSPPLPPGGPPPSVSRKRGAITAIACVSCRRKKRKVRRWLRSLVGEQDRQLGATSSQACSQQTGRSVPDRQLDDLSANASPRQCNGARPTCDSCNALKLPCNYEISPNERFQSDLRQKVRDLEKELSELKTALGPLASEASPQDRDAVIRTARQLHAQHQHQQKQADRLMADPMDALPHMLDPGHLRILGGGLGSNSRIPSLAPSSSAGMVDGTDSQHGSSSSMPMRVTPSDIVGHAYSDMSGMPITGGMTAMSGMTDDERSQGQSHDPSSNQVSRPLRLPDHDDGAGAWIDMDRSTQWLTRSDLQDYSMFFNIEDPMNSFAAVHAQANRDQAAVSYGARGAPMQLRDYRHEASRLGDFIEYIGAPPDSSAPASSSVPPTTYAHTTPHPQSYQLVKVPTYTLQPADTEQFPARF